MTVYEVVPESQLIVANVITVLMGVALLMGVGVLYIIRIQWVSK